MTNLISDLTQVHGAQGGEGRRTGCSTRAVYSKLCVCVCVYFIDLTGKLLWTPATFKLLQLWGSVSCPMTL